MNHILSAHLLSATKRVFGITSLSLFAIGLTFFSARMDSAVAQEHSDEIRICVTNFPPGPPIDGFRIDLDFDGEDVFSSFDVPADETCRSISRDAGRYEVVIRFELGANYGGDVLILTIFDGEGATILSDHWEGTSAGDFTDQVRTYTVEVGDPPATPVVGVTAGLAINEGDAAIFTFTAAPPPTMPLEVAVTVSQTGDFAYSDDIGARTVTIGTDGEGRLTVRTASVETDEEGEGSGSITVAVDDGEGYSGNSSASVSVRSTEQTQNQEEIAYRLCALDHGSEDGDDVNIYVNRRLVFDNHILTHAPHCETIRLGRDPEKNIITVRAISGGFNPPNSATLLIRHATSDTLPPLGQGEWLIDGGQQQEWDVYAISESEISLVPREVSSVRTQAVQGTVAAVAAAAVSNVTSNIGARFSAPSGGSSVSLAGTPVAFGSSEAKPWTGGTFTDHLDPFGNERGQSWQRTMSGSELLRASSFEIALGAAEGGKGNAPDSGRQVTVWGRGDFQLFESGGGRKSGYDGDLVAGYLGADFTTGENWLVGMAVSRIASEADYTLGGAGGGGKLEADLTNLHPYARFAVDDATEAWAILGFGRGEVKDTSQDGSESESDLSMSMMSAGARHRLNTNMGIDLALLGDGSLANVETDEGVEVVDGISASVWRARLGVEASFTTVWQGGSSLTSFVEVAGRQDGGDGAEGVGLEVSPGLAFSDPESGFSVEARGRALALHSVDNHKEYGASVTASLTPGKDGLGLSLAMTPTWGTPDNSLGSADASLFPQGTHGGHTDSLSLNSRVAYGFSSGRGIVAPFAELGLHRGDSRRMRIGSRYSVGSAVDLEMFGARYGGGSADPEHRAGLSGRIRF